MSAPKKTTRKKTTRKKTTKSTKAKIEAGKDVMKKAIALVREGKSIDAEAFLQQHAENAIPGQLTAQKVIFSIQASL